MQDLKFSKKEYEFFKKTMEAPAGRYIFMVVSLIICLAIVMFRIVSLGAQEYIDNWQTAKLEKFLQQEEQAKQQNLSKLIEKSHYFAEQQQSNHIAGYSNSGTSINSKDKRVGDGNRGSGNGNRGVIYDRGGNILATNITVFSAFIDATKLIKEEKSDTIKKLASVLSHIPEVQIAKKVNSNKQFIWLERSMHPKQAEQINNLGIAGIYFKKEQKRFYPHGESTSHIVGITDIDNSGIAGIEKFFDAELSLGYDVNLAIDIRIQQALNESLKDAVDKHRAKSASSILMDVKTGEIIGMASLPNYNPNISRNLEQKNMHNLASMGLYEMGSTFKSFTLAMGLESELISIYDFFDARKSIQIADYEISDVSPKNRFLSVPEIFVYSSNIGAARVATAVGADFQQNFLANLGLFQKTDIELHENARPRYSDNWGKSAMVTASYGYGVAITPVHMITAFSSLINGGEKLHATLLKKGEGGNSSHLRSSMPSGSLFSQLDADSTNNQQSNDLEGENQQGQAVQGQAVQQVITKKTSLALRSLLRLVVESGTGKLAEAEGYFLGGKTGTSIKYSSDRYIKAKSSTEEQPVITSFVGAFPIDNPKYSLIVLIDEPLPQDGSYKVSSYNTAAPLARETVKKIASILNITPAEKLDVSLLQNFKVLKKLIEDNQNKNTI